MAHLSIGCTACGQEVSTVDLPNSPTPDQLEFYETSSTCPIDGNTGNNIVVTVT